MSEDIPGQLLLFDTHESKAQEWMDTHPKAMAIFEHLALEKANAGQRFGMKALAEVVRWNYSLKYEGEEFKVNNNYVSYIGRELMKRWPVLGKYISTRRAGMEAAT